MVGIGAKMAGEGEGEEEEVQMETEEAGVSLLRAFEQIYQVSFDGVEKNNIFDASSRIKNITVTRVQFIFFLLFS